MKKTLLAALLFLLPSLALAAKPSETEPVAEKIAADFEQKRLELEAQELKQRQVLSALYSLNRKIKSIVSEKSSTQQSISFCK